MRHVHGLEIGVISVLFGAMRHVQTGNWGYIGAFWSHETCNGQEIGVISALFGAMRHVMDRKLGLYRCFLEP